MEAFHLKCQSPVELLSCRKTSAIQQSVAPATHCCSKTKSANTQRLCYKNLLTTTTRILAPLRKKALTSTSTSTSTLIAATTTTTTTATSTATTTVRTITAITNTLASASVSSLSLSGNNTHIPIRLRRRLPPLTSLYEQKQKQKQRQREQQQQQQHLIRKRLNIWGCLYCSHNLTCIMMTMLFLISIVLSGNTALAAQRESFKPKNANNFSNNGNAIYNELSSSSSNSGSSSNSIVGDSDGVGTSMSLNNNGNGNAINHSNNNNKNNGNTNVITTTSLSTSTSTSTSSSSAAGGGLRYATTTSTHITSSTLSSSGSGSSSSSSSSHKTSSSSRNSIELQEPTQNGPYFDKAYSKNVTALLGKTAYLNCRVKNLGNKTMLLQVSWVRHRDIHLLTVGRYTYTSDQRFRALHQPQTEDWILQIKYPQHRDSGIYECQVSTTPHMSHYIHLNVVEPSTEIIGAPDLYIESGSTINLTCVILNSPEPPAYIFWNHNNAIINYDSPRGGVSVVTNKGETTTSFLLIKSAKPSDSGHYQCNPSNAKPKSVTVHVLNGEFPAAMQRAGLAHHRMSQNHYILVYLLMYLFTLASVRHYTRLPAIVTGQKSVVM